MESTLPNEAPATQELSFDAFREEVLRDYRLACESRQASLLGRKEVLTGKAKFGIFGDGKEVPQVAMAKFFQPGDFYSGYYRDQTFAFATGAASIREFFSQLYADPDVRHDPHSGGRQMNSHFASPFVDADGRWLDLMQQKNITAGLAPTAGQMPRALGLAHASRAFREIGQLAAFPQLSNGGNEVCFCTIGDASTSEGHFWETLNAAAVNQVPLAVFVWDDGYGISVPKKYQTTKGNTTLQYCGVTPDLVPAIADRNEDKWGSKTIGTGVPISIPRPEATNDTRPRSASNGNALGTASGKCANGYWPISWRLKRNCPMQRTKRNRKCWMPARKHGRCT